MGFKTLYLHVVVFFRKMSGYYYLFLVIFIHITSNNKAIVYYFDHSIFPYNLHMLYCQYIYSVDDNNGLSLSFSLKDQMLVIQNM